MGIFPTACSYTMIYYSLLTLMDPDFHIFVTVNNAEMNVLYNHISLCLCYFFVSLGAILGFELTALYSLGRHPIS
jgi:hypothetical protein